MLTNSIYFRMTFWYVLALGLISGILSVFLYANFSRVLNKDFNHLLQTRAEYIGQVIDEATFDRARDRLEGVTWAKTDTDFLVTLRNAVEWGRGEGVFIQIFRQDGVELLHSGNMFVPLALVKSDSHLSRDNFLDSPPVVFSKDESWPLRTVIFPVHKGDNFYFVQVSASLRPLRVKLDRIKTVLVLFIPLAMILVTVMGVFLTRATLHPVDNMTRTMRQITSRNLRQRIAVPSGNDETRRLAETFNDMLARLEKAFAFQEQLVQDVSHELRTPLTALKGKQEVALNRRRSLEEYEEILAVNLEEIDKMNVLVENMLALAHFDRIEHELKIRKVNLTALIRSVMEGMHPLADDNGVRMTLLSSDEVTIEADGDQIRRAVSNIVDNALKYTPPKGQVAIRVFKSGLMAEVTVNDTGIGIAKDDLPRVFDRFYRAERSRTSPGFGLGLSIVKAIVLAHQGTVKVDSEPDKGATVTLSLPMHQD